MRYRKGSEGDVRDLRFKSAFFRTPAAMLLAQSIQSKDLLSDKVSQFILNHARINGTQEIKHVRLLFRASLNGWKPKHFHRYCDDKGPTLCLFRSIEDYLSAGFTSRSWRSIFGGTDVEDSSAMVFALTNELQVFKTNNSKKAVCHNSDCGPIF